MALTVDSREDLFQQWLNWLQSDLPDRSRSRGADLWIEGRIVSGAVWTILARLIAFDRNGLPDTAQGAALTRWGNVFSFPSKSAGPSNGALALLVTGISGSAVPFGTQLQHSDGTLYSVATTSAVIGGGSTGSVIVDVQAISKGSATNKVAGDTLSFTTPPTGVDQSATLIQDLTGGTDVEDQESFRARLLAHIGDPPQGGAIHDYIEWAKEVDGVTDAYVYLDRRGPGTVDVAVLGGGLGASRRISDTTAVHDFIIGATVGAGVKPANADVEIVDTVAQTQNVKIYIDQDLTKYKWDWNDFNTGVIITGNSSGGSTLTVASVPSDLKVGGRISVRGEEAKVTAIAGSVLTIAFTSPLTWFSFTVTNAVDVAMASGDLVVPVRTAILALFNRLGPARGSYAVTSWASDLLTDDIIAAAKGIVGDGNKTLVSIPSSDISPVDPSDTSAPVPFLVAGTVQVLNYRTTL